MTEPDLLQTALLHFSQALDEAGKESAIDPMAMSVATVGSDGRPSIRTLTLRKFDARGLVFFTNTQSRKAQDLLHRPYAAMCFYWHPLKMQVTFEGEVEALTATESDADWTNRSRESQLSAWASQQSQVLAEPSALISNLNTWKNKFRDQAVPRPQHWSGYRLLPERIEFWKSGWHRMHERICYYREGHAWKSVLLYP